MKKDIAIIGAGFGGITLGIFLQRCGYTTTIYEQSALAGGVASAWRRKKEYIFDGATNWLAGSSEHSNLHQLFQEIIDFDKLSFIYPDEFMRIEHGGEVLTLYNDLDKLENDMLRIAPEDSKVIKEFVDAVREVSQYDLPFDTAPETMNILGRINFLRRNYKFLRFFFKWKKVTIGEFAQKFKNRTLQALFERIFPHHQFFSLYPIITTLGWMSVKSGGYPVGGSEKLIEVLLNTYTNLGGTIRLRSEVESILVEDHSAVGVKLKSGEVIKSDRVCSTADVNFTFNRLLDNDYIHKKHNQIRDTHGIPYPGLIQVSVVTDTVYEHLPHKLNIDFNSPLLVGKTEKSEDMMIRYCDEASGLTPPNTTTFIVHIRVEDVAYWRELRKENITQYRDEKKRVAEIVIKRLKERFGDFKEIFIDTATPATYERYTNSHNGSYQGWAPTPKLIGKHIPKTIRGLHNFYMGGQWVWPAGGIPGVSVVSRHIAQIICKEDGVEFLSKPLKE